MVDTATSQVDTPQTRQGTPKNCAEQLSEGSANSSEQTTC